MAIIKKFILVCLFCMLGLIQACAQPQLQRYLPSFSGTNSSLSPPDGFTISVNQVVLTLGKFYDGNGSIKSDDLNMHIPVTLPIFIYVPKFKILGASYNTLVIFPIMNVAPALNDVDIDPSKIGIGNIFIQPIGLSWELNNFFISSAYGIHTQTGRYSPNANDNIGRGFWTQQLSLGATYQFGNKKSWTISAMNRFEFHSKMKDIDIYPGNNWTLDWGFGKALSNKWLLGITGYVGRQFQEETGKDAAKDRQKYAYQGIGGEITWIASKNWFLQLRGFQDIAKVINAARKTSVMLTVNWFINN